MKKKNGKNKLKILRNFKSKVRKKNQKTKVSNQEKKFQNKKIRVTLIGAFLVPVILIIVLGIKSYSDASKTITDNYEGSTIGTSQAMGMYLGLISSEVSSKMTEMANNSNLIEYYSKADRLTTSEGMDLYRDIKSTIVNMKASSDMIYSYHIFGEKGNPISSHGTLPSNTYEEYVRSPEGQEWSENLSMKEKWSGTHQYIDDIISLSKDNYALSLTKKFAKGNGYIVVDIKKDVILEVLEKMELGGNSVVAFVASDGREIGFPSAEEGVSIFQNEEFFQESQQTLELSGSSYVEYQDEEYLYIYDKIQGSDMMLCSLIPKADILAQVSGIKSSTFLIVILASFIAIIIGTWIATGISKEVKNMGNSFQRVSGGDFTTKFYTKRQDEFGALNKSAQSMIEHMRGIIGDVKGFASQVFLSSESVSGTAETILESTKDISTAMEEVGDGVVSQANDVEKSLKEMSIFSDKINLVCENTEKMGQVVDGAISHVTSGRLMIEELSDKSDATADVTKRIIREIEELEEHSSSIGSIIGAINEIAEQTNLLSLNASIEAARAGEHGRGFAVVASEIRRLAEQSVDASSKIKEIIDMIQVRTKGTVISAKEAENFLESQSEALGNTIAVFNDVNYSVDHLVEGLKEIAESMEDVGKSKEVVLDSIRDISAVSQEAAASSEEIIATVNEQVMAVTHLVEGAEELAKKAETLEEAMKQFLV